MHFDFDFASKNVGNTDRVVRAVLGVLLIGAAAVNGSWVGALIGAVLLGTAYLRFCPAYRAFGYSSIKDDGTAKDEVPAIK